MHSYYLRIPGLLIFSKNNIFFFLQFKYTEKPRVLQRVHYNYYINIHTVFQIYVTVDFII